MTDTRAAVLTHLEAFNRHDTAALLAGFGPEAVWVTGQDTFRGAAELAGLFDDELWALRPALELLSLVVEADRAAARLRETLTVDGELRTFGIAAFFDVANGLIRAAQIYRAGSADID